MGIEKFRFVSPGVQVNEIDDSILPTPEQPIGPVVIGNTAKGPAMQPVVVSSVAELEKIFGAPSNGIPGAVDVWRTGAPTSPTLATYAAKAFLRNASPITVIKLAGVEMNPAVHSGNPGWKADRATHLVLVKDVDTFVVDKPVVAIFKGPAKKVSELTSSFEFKKDGADIYKYKLDNSATWNITSNPIVRIEAVAGDHTLYVKSVTGSVESDVVSYSWTIDTVNDLISLTEKPDLISTDTTPNFEFTYETTVDYRYVLTINGVIGEELECNSPLNFEAENGEYSIEFRAYQTDTETLLSSVQYSWKLDTQFPNNLKSIPATTLEGVLAANIYHSDDVEIKLMSGSNSISSLGSGSAALSSGEFKLKFIKAGASSSYDVSFDPSKNSFIRDSLNTNPSKYNSQGFFLGESFEKSLPTGSEYNKVYIFSTTNFADFKTDNYTGATSATSPWVIGDYVNGSNAKSASKLFRFVGLNNGSFLSKDIKISIENVKPTKNENVTKYGTFDVVIRKLFELPSSPTLERFSNLSLDPSSANYILKRIGDSSRHWNLESERYEEDGSFPNMSAFVRIEMSEEDISPSDLPRGFMIPGLPNSLAFQSPVGLDINYPSIQFLAKAKKAAAKSTRFGLLSKSIENSDLTDLLSQKPFLLTEDAGTLTSPEPFHVRHLSASSNSYIHYNVDHYDNYDLFSSGSIQGFDMPLYGGFDGKNILEKEPFINNEVLLSETEFSSPEYRAIKQAIDIVAQPEIIDMNMLVVPGLQNQDLTDYMLEKCKERGDSLAIIDLDHDYKYDYESGTGKEQRPSSVHQVVETVKGRRLDNSYGAAYFPAVFVPSEGIYLPASIAALGAIGGTEGRQALWFAPAGFNRGGLTEFNSGINVSRTALSLIASDRDRLYESAINPIATFPNEGVVIFGQKTLQAFPSALDRVNVRRLVNYLKKQISRYATKVLFEPNVEATWNSFKSQVEPFLLQVKSGFGIDDARVVLDSSTTTADLIDRNMMYCKIYIKPTRAIEYIAIDFIVTNSGASFVES